MKIYERVKNMSVAQMIKFLVKFLRMFFEDKKFDSAEDIYNWLLLDMEDL